MAETCKQCDLLWQELTEAVMTHLKAEGQLKRARIAADAFAIAKLGPLVAESDAVEQECRAIWRSHKDNCCQQTAVLGAGSA